MTFMYQKAVDALKAEITAGRRWKPGDAFLGVKDICARFQVSHLTAVRVLDGLKALQLVESRRGAGTFVAQTRRLIGFLSPDFGLAPFFPLIRKEVSDLCQRNGITFEVHEIDHISRPDFPVRLENAAHTLVAHKPSGIIYLPAANITPFQDCDSPPSHIDSQILAPFAQAKIPVVLLDSGIESPLEDRYDLVGVDNRAIGVKLGRHLVEQDARRILFVSWQSSSPNVRDRLSGLKEVVCTAGKDLSAYVLTKSNIRDFRLRFKSSERPDAVVCSSDRVALMVLNLLRKSGIRVPEDVLLSGIDGIAPARDADLTTVQQPFREIARAACETLLNRIARPGSLPRHLTLATTLLPRASTARAQTHAQEGACGLCYTPAP